jgi:hypothetical protein
LQVLGCSHGPSFSRTLRLASTSAERSRAMPLVTSFGSCGPTYATTDGATLPCLRTHLGARGSPGASRSSPQSSSGTCSPSSRLCSFQREFLSSSHNTATRIASKSLRLAAGEFLGGAICEWASARPRIALLAKSWGSLRASSPEGDFPLTGTLTTV